MSAKLRRRTGLRNLMNSGSLSRSQIAVSGNRKQRKPDSKPNASSWVRPRPRSLKWVFRISSLLGVPLALLALLEVGLRIGGYGYNTGFFKPLQINGADYLVENDKFGLRFFPPELARSPAPLRMEAHKPAEMYRIFVLGESAALGDPRPAYGAGRYLQVLLQARFPKMKFEVVCAAVTAINSHALLPIARECARNDGDLWIIYMGNNELVGPFGATTVFGRSAPPLWVVRLGLGLQKCRVGQFIMALGRGLGARSSSNTPWAGMEMFMKSQVAPNDTKRDIVIKNFHQNLEDILWTGFGSGAQIILNTVAVNLKDSPPFASLPPSDPAAQTPGQRAFESGETAAKTGDYVVALRDVQEACRLAPESAAFEFRLGQIELALANFPAATKAFQRACDLDALPFRAGSSINDAITSAAKEFAGPKLDFFDAAGYFATNGPAGGPGQDIFYEHVHFNFDGNYRVARAWAAEVERFLPESARQSQNGDWADQGLCERRLGLTDWNRADVLDDMLRRMAQPPLSSQSDNGQRVARFQAELKKLRSKMDMAAAKAADALYLDAVQRAPEDFQLHENFAQFLEAVGDLGHATEEWKRVRDLIPHHHLGWFETGRLLSRQGRWPEAELALRQAVTLRPDLSEGWLELGQIYYHQEKQIEALKEYERARRLLPQDPRVYYRMGKSLSRLSRRSEAIRQFRKAIELRQTYWEGVYALGEELAFDGNLSEARFRFEEVTKLKPDYALAHLNLGVALVQEGQLEQAKEQFQETLRLEPGNKLAKDYLGQLQKRSQP